LTASAAFAGVADCKKIDVPLERLACYDNLAAAKPAATAAKRVKPELVLSTQPQRAQAAQIAAFPPVDPPGKLWWFEAEQSFYGLSKGRSSPLIISGDSTITASNTFAPIPTAPGFIGLSTQQTALGRFLANENTLFGGDGLNTGIRSGEALRFGRWLDPEHNQAIEGGGFYIGRGSSSFASAPDGKAVAIPFADANGVGQLFVVNRPLTVTNTRVSVNTTPAVFVHLFDTATSDQATGAAMANYNNSLWGLDLNYRLRTPLLRGRGMNVDVSAGVKYVNFNETLALTTSSTASHAETTTFDPALGLPPPANSTFTNSSTTTTATNDVIKTSNKFIGPQFGIRGDIALTDRWSISSDAKVAIGANSQTLSVSGATGTTTATTTTPTQTTMLAGIPLTTATGPAVTTTTSTASANGIFASPNNSGDRTRTVFAYLPSGTFKLNYDVVPDTVTLSLGYNVFWISDVLRASNQTFSAGAPTFAQSGLLAQGVTLSAKAKF